MNGPEAISYQAIEAWARLSGRSPDPLDVGALMALDRTLRAVLSEK